MKRKFLIIGGLLLLAGAALANVSISTYRVDGFDSNNLEVGAYFDVTVSYTNNTNSSILTTAPLTLTKLRTRILLQMGWLRILPAKLIRILRQLLDNSAINVMREQVPEEQLVLVKTLNVSRYAFMSNRMIIWPKRWNSLIGFILKPIT